MVLNPLELAEKALSPPQDSLLAQFAWEPFWESFPGSFDAESFAEELHRLFVDSFSFTTAHPTGPMWLLPKPLRSFIRRFVEAGAIETTRRLRRREEGFRWRGSAEKFTTPFRDPKIFQIYVGRSEVRGNELESGNDCWGRVRTPNFFASRLFDI